MLAAIPFLRTPGAIWAYGRVFGAVQGVQGVLMGSGFAHYFGREHIGAIKGFAKTIFVGGSSAGPLVFAAGLDWIGDYTLILLATAALSAGLAFSAALLREDGLYTDANGREVVSLPA